MPICFRSSSRLILVADSWTFCQANQPTPPQQPHSSSTPPPTDSSTISVVLLFLAGSPLPSRAGRAGRRAGRSSGGSGSSGYSSSRPRLMARALPSPQCDQSLRGLAGVGQPNEIPVVHHFHHTVGGDDVAAPGGHFLLV